MLTIHHRLLVVTRHSPLPENDGAGAYLFDLLARLKEAGAQIDLLWLQPDSSLYRSGWYCVPGRVHRVARLHLPGAIACHRLRLFPSIWWLPTKARTLHAVKTLLCRVPFFRRRFAQRQRLSAAASSPPAWSALPSPAETALFRRIHAQVGPHSVLANYCWLAPLLDETTGARTLVLTHDVASHRLPLTTAARYDLPPQLNPALPAGEAALLGRADAIIAISDDDAEIFRQMQPARTVLVAPKSAPPTPKMPVSTTRRGRCLFVGGRNRLNEEGLRWFLTAVWPEVVRQRPYAQLHVCGAVGGAVLDLAGTSVILRGRLADLTPEYAAAEAVIVPLLHGTGMKIKLVEAASHGKACVTTAVGLQGMPYFRNAVLCADGPADFGSALVRVLDDFELRAKLGRDLQAAACRHLSPEAAYEGVERWLRLSPRAVYAVRPAVSLV